MKQAQEIFIDNKSEVGVLLLHSFTSSPGEFGELADFLAERDFSVFVPIIAGHGSCPEDLRKTCPQDWTLSVLLAYQKLKQVSKKIVVVGNSFGGNLAFWLAKETNNDLAGVVSLSAPLFLRFYRFIRFRYWLYGRFKRYYKKPPWAYKKGEARAIKETSYSVIPIKTLKEFWDFLKNETMPNLPAVKVPVLISYAVHDFISLPATADFFYKKISSPDKEIYWVNDRCHVLTNSRRKSELFEKIYDFIKKI